MSLAIPVGLPRAPCCKPAVPLCSRTRQRPWVGPRVEPGQWRRDDHALPLGERYGLPIAFVRQVARRDRETELFIVELFDEGALLRDVRNLPPAYIHHYWPLVLPGRPERGAGGAAWRGDVARHASSPSRGGGRLLAGLLGLAGLHEPGARRR